MQNARHRVFRQCQIRRPNENLAAEHHRPPTAALFHPSGGNGRGLFLDDHISTVDVLSSYLVNAEFPNGVIPHGGNERRFETHARQADHHIGNRSATLHGQAGGIDLHLRVRVAIHGVEQVERDNPHAEAVNRKGGVTSFQFLPILRSVPLLPPPDALSGSDVPRYPPQHGL